ncbi:hypothetical protein AnigIFM56816_002206 [Aspergillus niger]|nr:hypothetical protein AnigIFM56816_002206 [Aspergillus niger]
MVQLIVEDDDLGLNVLHEGPLDASGCWETESTKESLSLSPVDIVAIHGVGAHPLHTWSHWDPVRKTVLNWLWDENMLHSDLPQARIMIFGYRSEWKGRRPSDVSSTEIAKHFLQALARARKSLAMAYQDELHHNRYDRIFSSTVGVIFMGTPFRGAHGGLSNGEILAAADEQIRMLKDEDERREAIIVKRILDILTPGNESLFNLLTNFLSIPDDLMPQLLCLYETQPANVWKIIGHSKNKEILVPRDCATLDRVDCMMMEANHFEMNKFSGRNEAYRMMLSKLKDFLSEDALSIYYSDRNSALNNLNPNLARIQIQTAPAPAVSGDLGMKYCISFSRTSAVPQPKRRQQRTNLYATRNHVRQPYAALRMQVERQQPVYFLDALGRVTPFHLEFIRSAEAFIAVLQDNFKKFAPAKEMIQKGDFAIYDLATERDIDLTKHWETVFRPGQAVAMCMIFRPMETRKDFCPACENECSQPLRRGAQCINCGAIFRRLAHSPLKIRRALDGFSKTAEYGSRYRKSPENTRIDTPPPTIMGPDRKPEQDSVISMFRNVRVLSSNPVERSPKVWCTIEGWSYSYNDNIREQRSGWCYVENNDTVILESHLNPNVAYFVRRLSAEEYGFLWYEPHKFGWDQPGTGGWLDSSGRWQFVFQSRQDLQVIWGYIRSRRDLTIGSLRGTSSSPDGYDIYPDEEAAPLHGTRGINWLLEGDKIPSSPSPEKAPRFIS